MLNLLKTYINDYEVEKAIIVGRNIVNRDPNNQEGVGAFLDFLLELAETLPVPAERREYLDQAKVIVSYVEENCTLNPEYLEWILSYSVKILDIEKKIIEDEDVKINKIVYDIELANNKALTKIHKMIGELDLVESQDEFDKMMKEFIELDRGIEKDYLTPEDQQQYDELSKLCSEMISKKMQELEHIRNVDYNREALADFFNTYIEFHDNEGAYKANIDLLISMLQNKFFKYETGRLFSETLMYNQFVYSRIFEKLSDDGKALLTKAAIEASK